VTDKHLEDQANGVGAAARTTLRLTIDVASADAGGPLPGNSPTPTPVPTPVPCGGDRCVFVSSGRFTANLGGLSGADAKCQSAATAAGLPGTYQAWLSDYSTGAATRFMTRSATPYRRVDGALVASNWADLTDGTLANAISIDETGAPTSLGLVWTNTSASGTPLSTGPTGTCSNWTFGGAPSPGGGRRGAALATNFTWTDAISEAVCFLQLNLYCFQQ
jgi:hypothetical protein